MTRQPPGPVPGCRNKTSRATSSSGAHAGASSPFPIPPRGSQYSRETLPDHDAEYEDAIGSVCLRTSRMNGSAANWATIANATTSPSKPEPLTAMATPQKTGTSGAETVPACEKRRSPPVKVESHHPGSQRSLPLASGLGRENFGGSFRLVPGGRGHRPGAAFCLVVTGLPGVPPLWRRPQPGADRCIKVRPAG